MAVKSKKYLRMNRIRDDLAKGPRTLNELLFVAFEVKESEKLPRSAIRTLQGDLGGLKILGIVFSKGGRYYLAENIISYRNQAEHQLAWNHSRRLVLSTKSRRGLDQMGPDEMLRCFSIDIPETLITQRKIENNLKKTEVDYFLSHMKSGYYVEIYQNILRYREIAKKYPKIEQILRRRDISWSGWDENETVEIDPKDDIFKGPYGVPDSLTYGSEPIPGTDYSRSIRHEGRTVVFREVVDNLDVTKEYINIKYNVAAKVYELIGQVRNGVPLDGHCTTCPLRHIKIEE